MSKASDKKIRKGITFKELFNMFPDNTSSEKRFVKQQWSNGVTYPECGSDNVQVEFSHKSKSF